MITARLPLLRAVGATSGRAAAARALPMFAGVALFGAVILGGNGVPPAEVAGALRASAIARAAALLGWAVLAAPAAVAAFRAPGTHTLRSLPVARGTIAGALGALVLALQLPPAALLAAGGDARAAATFACAAGALETLFAGAPARPRALVLAAAVLLAVVPRAPFALAFPVTAAALALATWDAWRLAPERAGGGRALRVVAGPPWLALAVAHALHLGRTSASRVARGAVVAVAMGAVAAVAAKNRDANAPAAVAAVALFVAALALSVALGGACVEIDDSDARLAWIARSTGTSRAARAAASALLATSIGATAGLLFAASACAVGRFDARTAGRLAFDLAVWGVAIALVLLAAARRASARDRFVVVQAAVTAGALALTAAGDALAIGAMSALAVAATLLPSAPSAPS